MLVCICLIPLAITVLICHARWGLTMLEYRATSLFSEVCISPEIATWITIVENGNVLTINAQNILNTGIQYRLELETPVCR